MTADGWGEPSFYPYGENVEKVSQIGTKPSNNYPVTEAAAG